MTASVCRLQHGFFRFYVLDSRLRGNDESIHTKTCTTSFPRTPTSRHSHKNRNLKSRHSRAGGNPDLSVRTLIG
ncbi:hypothetical protein FOG13_03095 [Neisseria meningitidis]|nr:hypothetical protein [Neisseria meningitidis]